MRTRKFPFDVVTIKSTDHTPMNSTCSVLGSLRCDSVRCLVVLLWGSTPLVVQRSKIMHDNGNSFAASVKALMTGKGWGILAACTSRPGEQTPRGSGKAGKSADGDSATSGTRALKESRIRRSKWGSTHTRTTHSPLRKPARMGMGRIFLHA